MNSPRSLLLGGCASAVALLVTGCAGPIASGPRPAFVGADYHQVYLTGSHIPVLVPKSPTAKMLPTVSPLSILTADELRRRGNFPMH